MAGSSDSTGSAAIQRPNPSAPRDQSLDVARGIAIVLVVLGHVVRGLFASGLVDASLAGWAFVDKALYLLHLPVFAFATGLLMPRPVERDGQVRYLRGRLAMLVYVFLLWTLIEGTAEVLTSSVKNVPVTWIQVVTIWRPLGPLWFLPLLMLATLVVVVLAPWRGGRVRLLAAGLTVVASVAFWGLEGDYAFTRGLALVAWFVLGALVTFERFGRWSKGARPASLFVIVAMGTLVWVVAAWTPWVTAPTVIDPDRSLLSVAAGVVGVLGALTATLSVSILMARLGSPGALLAYPGRLSLQVYLAHVVFTAGTRVVLVRVGVVDPTTHVALGTAAGIAGPLLLERVTRGLPWLFAPPSRGGRGSS